MTTHDLLYFAPCVALALFTLYLIGVFVRWCRDNERHLECAEECRTPYWAEYAYRVAREAREEMAKLKLI